LQKVNKWKTVALSGWVVVRRSPGSGLALLFCGASRLLWGWSLCGRFGGFGGFVLSAIEGVPWECSLSFSHFGEREYYLSKHHNGEELKSKATKITRRRTAYRC